MSGANHPNIVYFSSTSNNTHRFVEKLPFPAHRIPIKITKDAPFIVNEPYILVVPTYGGGKPGSGKPGKYVPIQVIKFLNNPSNREKIRGVIASGNLNFNEEYGVAGDIISMKCKVPFLYRFELMGTPEDVNEVSERINFLWNQQELNNV